MSNALALYENDKVKLAGTELSALENTVIEQMKFVRRAHPESSMRVILSALGLRRIKASLGHGNWEPWLKRNAVPIWGLAASRTIRNWMRLADVFVEHSKLALPDFLALPGDQQELALSAESDANARRLMQSLEEFVGDLGPTELMIEHDIREGSAAKKKRKLLKGSAPASAAAQEQTVQDRFNEIETALRLARSGACDKGTWMSFDRKQHDDLKHIFTEAANAVDAIYLKTHGRNARK